jgi:tRNA (guanine37-N1)-methyltransferase
MKFDIITIFPDFFSGFLNESLLKKAQENNLIEIKIHNLRDFTQDKHNSVDDTPFGGGAGMVMMVEPLSLAISQIWDKKGRIILTSADGEKFDQKKAKELSNEERLLIICGHYTGVDERIKSLFPIEEISIGDYVLTGGEIPTMVIIDAISRLIPGFLGNFQSAQNDSFYDGILGFPQYTRPAEYQGLKAPEVLLSGHHEKIRLWRKKEALKKTLQKRKELLNYKVLSKEEKKIIKEIEEEEN